MMISGEIFEKINQSNNILIVSHINPDGDTLGSAGAFLFYLNSQNKKTKLFCSDQISNNLNFLDLNQFIIKKENLDLNNFDLIITVDCGDQLRTGLIEIFNNNHFIINIDHHATNPNFGNINLVEPHASSTCEVVFKILQENKTNFNQNMATCLLTGILTDTSFFSNSATNPQAIEYSSILLNYGANIKNIIKNTWKNQTPESLRIWGEILSRLEYNKKEKIVTAVITKQEMINPNIFEGLANFLTAIYEADIILVLRQVDDNLIKGSLRTTKENIDVSKLAQKFGGGGHTKAAGFTVEGNIIKTETGWKII